MTTTVEPRVNTTEERRLAARWYIGPFIQGRTERNVTGYKILAEMEDENGQPVDVTVGIIRYAAVAEMICDQHNQQLERWAVSYLVARYDEAREAGADARDYRIQRYKAWAYGDLSAATAILSVERS